MSELIRPAPTFAARGVVWVGVGAQGHLIMTGGTWKNAHACRFMLSNSFTTKVNDRD